MIAKTTKFRALRNFLRSPGVDVVAGELLELTDAEAAGLIWMAGTIEPVEARDRRRVHSVPSVKWERPAEEPARSERIYFGPNYTGPLKLFA